jgi:hypothetical protein
METSLIHSMPWVEQFHTWVRPLINQPASWAQVIQAVVSIIGFFVLFIQVLRLRDNIRGATHDRLYAHYNDVCKELMKKPELYPYFYGGEPYTAKCTPKDATNEVKLLSEMIWGVIEHSKVQENNLPLDSWASCWLPYSLERIDKSPAVYEFFGQNSEWYTPSVKSVFCQYEQYKKDGKDLKKIQRKVRMVALGKRVLFTTATIIILMLFMMTLLLLFWLSV